MIRYVNTDTVIDDWRRLRRRLSRGRSLSERFTDVADVVSNAMGTPGNILVWLAFIAGYTIIFAVHPVLAQSSFLPAWFTSQAYNFPLNLVTTVAELFIGFLCAAATNRAQRALTTVLSHITELISNVKTLDAQMIRMEKEHGLMIREMKEVLADLHAHVSCTGHTVIESAPVVAKKGKAS
jgi:low affinity Fe/Cu permease